MKKILASLVLVFCFAFTMMGVGGCSGCSSNNDETHNGGQSEVKTITTLEGIWESEHDRGGEHEKIIVVNGSIRIYINQGINHEDELSWVGIYIPFSEPISNGEWTFEYDNLWSENKGENSIENGSKTFKYLDGKLSCKMIDWMGRDQTIYFTKVSD